MFGRKLYVIPEMLRYTLSFCPGISTI